MAAAPPHAPHNNHYLVDRGGGEPASSRLYNHHQHRNSSRDSDSLANTIGGAQFQAPTGPQPAGAPASPSPSVIYSSSSSLYRSGQSSPAYQQPTPPYVPPTHKHSIQQHKRLPTPPRSVTPTSTSNHNLLGLPDTSFGGPQRLRRNSTTALHSGMLPPASPSALLGGFSSMGSGNFLDPNFRRRLPAVPGRLSGSPVSFRRASSPRMLPTPPPVSGSNPPSPHFSSGSPSPPSSAALIERRPSRRLPKEPPTPPVLPPSPLVFPSPLPNSPSRNVFSPPLQRHNRHAYLPPTPPEYNTAVSPPSSSRDASPSPMPNSRQQSQSPSISPREHNQLGAYHGPHRGGVQATVARTRKFSDVRDIAPNGSMASVLEQQHILRQEFTQRPDSQTAMAHSVSDHSSLISPSMEQLNCGSSKSSSSGDGDNPSVHGLDPSLYKSPNEAHSTDGASPVNGHYGSNGSMTTGGVMTNGSSAANVAANGAAAGNSPSHTAANGFITPSGSFPENEPRPKGLGLIYCSLQHFPVRKRLRVSVLKIEGLAGELKPELEIQPFCKVSLLPARHHKQQVSVVKRGRDAVFNQEFFFDNVSTEEIDARILQIEVCHQGTTKLQKDMAIGDMTVPLKELTQLHTKKEVRIVEELKHACTTKKLGKLSITTSIQNKVLTVNIIKVEDLPKWSIIGAPDVCVRVKVYQETAKAKDQTQIKHSRVMKSTCSAVYKESIAFLIQSKAEDLEKTVVTVSVHDQSRSVTGDDFIGGVVLSLNAPEKSEADMWKNTIEHMGKEYKATFHLKPSNQTPDVRVSETNSDDEN